MFWRRVRIIVIDTLRALLAQAGQDQPRWSFWLPVCVAVGIGVYFALPDEPSLLWLSLPLLILAAIYPVRQHMLVRYLLTGVLAAALGFCAAQLRTAYVMSPMLSHTQTATMLEGTILERDAQIDSLRLLLGDVSIARLDAGQTPVHVRLTVRRFPTDQLALGARIKVLANLLPPSEPMMPGGYNFRRQAYYDQLGAYAIALKPPEVVQPPQAGGLWAERWREAIAGRVKAQTQGAEGAIAVALMTGERGAIDNETNANMRAAGTAHLLSISGMHIGMLGGMVFFCVRALLALSPRFALTWPIKQIAAVCALIVITAYTLMVGAPIPAQRSLIMAGLIFIAILLNRQALSMRTVALSAGVLLLLFPESLFNPGFQMSFAAMVLLIASYEKLPQVETPEERPSWARRIALYVWGIIFTSIIAGLATMPFAAWNFHRIQLYGVLGNLIAVPLTGFIVMPAALLAYVLMPFGLEAPALWAMNEGLRGVTGSAAWVANMPGATYTIAQFGALPLLLMVAGGLWIGLWQQRMLRWLGLVPILLGVLLVPLAPQPIALVSAEGKVAVRTPDGSLAYQRPARGMIAQEWGLAFDEGNAPVLWSNETSGMTCDQAGCVSASGLAMPRYEVAMLEDCRRSRVLIAPKFRAPDDCQAAVIDRKSLREHGAYAVYADGRLETARPSRNRPWISYSGVADPPDAPAP